MTEDEMVGRHHRLNGRATEETPGDMEVHGVVKIQTQLSDWQQQAVKSPSQIET